MSIDKEMTTDTKGRDPYFDNARFFLVGLVVLGHMISPARHNSDIIYFANNFLGSFRMPVLILITGYFSKRFYQEGFMKKITMNILIPYLIFQVFYGLMNDYIYDNERYAVSLFSPTYAMWFLLGLFFWNGLLFVFDKIKYPILIAFILGIGVGWLDDAGHYLSISRVFVFFPFFLMGHHLEAKHFEWFKKPWMKLVSIISLSASWLILSAFTLYEVRSFLLGKYPYIEIADSYWEGSGIRVVFYIVMLLGVFVFLPWVPKKEMFFSGLGKRTAYIYILHIFFMKVFKTLELSPEFQWWYALAVPVIWGAIIFITSSNYMVFLTKPFIQGTVSSFLFKESKQK